MPPCRAGHIGGEVMLLIAVIVLFTVAVAIGVFFFVPPAEGLGALVRIAFFHIPMAWVAVLAFFQNAWWGAAFLRRNDFAADVKSAAAAQLGLLFTLGDGERRTVREADLGGVLELGSSADHDFCSASHLRRVPHPAGGHS